MRMIREHLKKRSLLSKKSEAKASLTFFFYNNVGSTLRQLMDKQPFDNQHLSTTCHL